MKQSPSLNPIDVPVALALIDTPHATYQALADALAISPSTVHQSVARLRQAGLVHSSKQEVIRTAVLEFLEHGVRYAFPGSLQPSTRGIPTAHAGPALASRIAADEPMVWPSDRGQAFGAAVTPLYERAPEMPERSPGIYWLLTLVDALRVGRLRERKEALEMLRDRLYPSAAVAA